MSERGDRMICMVCGRTLWQVPGPDGKELYQHGLLDLPEEFDHLPVAARAGDAPAQEKPRCDFCMAEPVTYTLVSDTQVYLPVAKVLYDEEWAMCTPCAELGMANDWVGLRRRLFQEADRRHGSFSEEAKTEMRVGLRDLRDHVVMYYAEAS